MQKGYLTLQDGQQFQGEASEDWADPVEGEIVFFTGMTGYQEVLTDPSYQDQIVVFTYPLIGNYGINEDDFESSKPQVKGVVMLQCADTASHYKATTSLKDYLQKARIPFLTAVDTREVTKAIRTGGTRQAALATTPTKPKGLPAKEQIFQAKGEEPTTYGQGTKHIALIDFGFKQSILTRLLEKGVRVTVVPFTELHAIDELSPDGVVLSNGPGDPKDTASFLPKLKIVLESYPTLGICLGHQVIALTFGADTKKLSFGHRGANHPVKDLKTGRVFLTSQNHNYVVDEDSLENTALHICFTHVNDQSVEGLKHDSLPIFSAQFHPEAKPGPEDALWLFDNFFELVTTTKGEKAYV
ncbi:carbamoyl phosphate synthase small subunit [Halobacillus shinanisalinarum]|uniref:Carbamoyl phosphate synthase small chain n=1 Tax=Halobacillus shinanisalinarum TaxID=2932258 RepID=A0ABY4H4S0_9BACI|nr:carbamoyl phosphate synthase small subunit [Halobacillus shinanisalinarum]UOQ95314.1 carbamoyl phosphate synthase small subunit [Halobacillus shinanisalinarum]